MWKTTIDHTNKTLKKHLLNVPKSWNRDNYFPRTFSSKSGLSPANQDSWVCAFYQQFLSPVSDYSFRLLQPAVYKLATYAIYWPGLYSYNFHLCFFSVQPAWSAFQTCFRNPPKHALCLLLQEHKAPQGTQPRSPLLTSFDSAQILLLVPLPTHCKQREGACREC